MDGALLAFQMEEVLDAIKLVICGLVLLGGIGLWIHATYFRNSE